MKEKTPLWVIVAAITLATTIAATPALIQIQSAYASVINSTFRGGTIAVSGSNVYAIWWERSGNTAEPFLRISYGNGNTFGQKIMLSNATTAAFGSTTSEGSK